MSFELLRDKRATDPDFLSLSIHVSKQGPNLCIRMRQGILKRLGWAEGVKLGVFVGYGDDKGKIRVKRSTRFARSLQVEHRNDYPNGEAPFYLRSALPPGLPKTTQPATRCKWRIAANDPQALEIDLPRWAR
jgi:hypothetical protein